MRRLMSVLASYGRDLLEGRLEDNLAVLGVVDLLREEGHQVVTARVRADVLPRWHEPCHQYGDSYYPSRYVMPPWFYIEAQWRPECRAACAAELHRVMLYHLSKREGFGIGSNIAHLMYAVGRSADRAVKRDRPAEIPDCYVFGKFSLAFCGSVMEPKPIPSA